MIDGKNTRNDFGRAAESASNAFDGLSEQIKQSINRSHMEKVLREIRDRRRNRPHSEVVE